MMTPGCEYETDKGWRIELLNDFDKNLVWEGIQPKWIKFLYGTTLGCAATVVSGLLL